MSATSWSWDTLLGKETLNRNDRVFTDGGIEGFVETVEMRPYPMLDSRGRVVRGEPIPHILLTRCKLGPRELGCDHPPAYAVQGPVQHDMPDCWIIPANIVG